jgi:hypothetical protein
MQWRRRWRRLSDSPEKVEKAGKGNKKGKLPESLNLLLHQQFSFFAITF